jgi:hypothetical protein
MIVPFRKLVLFVTAQCCTCRARHARKCEVILIESHQKGKDSGTTVDNPKQPSVAVDE